MILRTKQSGLNRQPGGFKEELIESIERKYRQAIEPADKLVVKWIGWLAVFLSLSRKERLDFARDDEQVKETLKKLMGELYEFGRRTEKKRKSGDDAKSK